MEITIKQSLLCIARLQEIADMLVGVNRGLRLLNPPLPFALTCWGIYFLPSTLHKQKSVDDQTHVLGIAASSRRGGIVWVG